MKVFGFVLIFLSITYTVFSMELVTELKYQGFDTEKIDFDDEALGRVTLKDNSNENYSFLLSMYLETEQTGWTPVRLKL